MIQTKNTTGLSFIDDKEKMRDFLKLSKEEFLNSYSYLTKEDYETTEVAYQYQNLQPLNRVIDLTLEEIKGFKLSDIFRNEHINKIHIEDYNGSTILCLNLEDYDITDVENGILRLQLNRELENE